MNCLDIDWAYLRLANRILAEYILSPDVYRYLTPVKTNGSAGELSQLAIGNILLSLKRLQAIPLSGAEQDELAGLNQQIAQVHDCWQEIWERKALSERTERQNFWQSYLNELTTAPKLYSRSYPSKVRSRVIIRLLDEQIGHSESNADAVFAQQDVLLRSISSQGPFVWEEELVHEFPQDSFWFLYRNFQ